MQLSWVLWLWISQKAAVISRLCLGKIISKLTQLAVSSLKICFLAHSQGHWQPSSPHWLLPGKLVSCHVALSTEQLTTWQCGERESKRMSKTQARTFL